MDFQSAANGKFIRVHVGLLQNDALVWENIRDERTSSGGEYKILEGSSAHNKFFPGSVEV
jgi:hypothetical protein